MSKSSLARMVRAVDVWDKLDMKVQAKDGTTDALHILDKPDGDGLLEAIADLLVKAELKTRNRFAVTVDYSKPLETMVAEGKYGYVNPDITAQNFPKSGEGIVETELVIVHFNSDISSNDAVAELNRMGLKPAKIEHACALGAKRPGLQRKYPIVFLGSVWKRSDGDRKIPCLDRQFERRRLHLYSWCTHWHHPDRFAAVRPTPPLGSAGHGK